MQLVLRRFYYKQLLVPVILFLAFNLLRYISPALFSITSFQGYSLTVVFFSSCAAFGLGFPILYRSYFAYRMRQRNSILKNEFIVFEKRLLIICLISVYFALSGIILGMPHFYQYGMILIAMYAAYYYYPSKKRLNLDIRIYRVNEDHG